MHFRFGVLCHITIFLLLSANSICRAGESYIGRRYVDEGFPSDRRGAFGPDIHDRNMYPPPPSAGTMWSQPRRNFDEEFATTKDYRRYASTFCNDGNIMNLIPIEGLKDSLIIIMLLRMTVNLVVVIFLFIGTKGLEVEIVGSLVLSLKTATKVERTIMREIINTGVTAVIRTMRGAGEMVVGEDLTPLSMNVKEKG